MFDVILVSHGPLAAAMLESAQLICGEQQRVKTYGLYHGDSIDDFEQTVVEAIDESLSHGELVVITDIMFGSPFNVVSRAMPGRRFRHLVGMSLAMVSQVLMERNNLDVEGVAASALDAAAKAVVDVNELLADVLED